LVDPINMLDELGGVVDALGGTSGRESVWNSDRRFGDILWGNIDQNRDILRYDDAFHPYARFGGQFASGLLAPGASIEGVGLGAARTALRSGASRFAAEAAAKAAVRNRLMAAGAIEGGLAGFGAGEGSPVERLPSAAAGAGLGAAFGAGTGELLPYLNGGARKLMGRSRSRDAWSEFQDAAPEGPAKSQDLSTTERGALAGERQPPVTQVGGVTESTGLPVRTIDRIDIWSEFPDVPSGAVDDPILGRVRSMGARITPDEMAATARTVLPEDVTPLPSNAIALTWWPPMNATRCRPTGLGRTCPFAAIRSTLWAGFGPRVASATIGASCPPWASTMRRGPSSSPSQRGFLGN
jgi:hypothetical protein